MVHASCLSDQLQSLHYVIGYHFVLLVLFLLSRGKNKKFHFCSSLIYKCLSTFFFLDNDV
jgi:hypothetical protein